MKRLKIIGLVVAGLAAVAVIIAIVWPNDEPSWHGVTLSKWLERLRNGYITGNKSPDEDPLVAIEQIGTNAVPTLIKMMQAKDGAVKSKIIGLVNGQRLVHVHLKTARETRGDAVNGVRFLGTNGLGALPQLLKMARDSNTPSLTRTYALDCVARWRRYPELAVPALANSLTNEDAEIQFAARRSLLGFFPEDAARLRIDPQSTNQNPVANGQSPPNPGR